MRASRWSRAAFAGSLHRLTGEERVVAPPGHPQLLGLVRRGDEQPDLDGQQLDVQEVDADVAGDHEALVQDPFEHVGERVALGWPHREVVGAHVAHPSWEPRV